MFHKIKHLSTKILSHFCVVCFGKAGFCKHCRVNRLDLLVSWRLQVLLIDKRVTKSNFLKQGLRLCVGENTCEEIAVFVVCGNLFFAGDSRLNCRIIESIFDMNLVYLHTLVHRSMSFIPVHVTKICFDFIISNFRLVTSKMRYLEFRYLEFSRKIVYFSLQTSRKILRKFNDFSWKIRENKG